jgi:cation transport ATPase
MLESTSWSPLQCWQRLPRDYKTAGVVAFFMLLGEIIETRIAGGARARLNVNQIDAPKAGASPPRVKRSPPRICGGRCYSRAAGRQRQADGLIEWARLNQSTINGEPLPADKKPATASLPAHKISPGPEIKVSRRQDTTLGRFAN